MSYLELAKQAEARLRASREIQTGYERNEFTKEGLVPGLAEAVPFLGMPLDVFAREGASLAVRVPWLEVTLWMVPTDQDAAALVGEGVNRGQIWTSIELMNLMSIADRTPDMVKRLALAKLELGGEVVGVRRR